MMSFVATILVVILLQGHMTTGNDDVNSAEVVIQQMSRRVDQLEARLGSYENELQELKKLQPSVIFSVQYASRYFTSNNNVAIPFDRVLINKGGGYSPRHGEFTAPVSGLYYVSFRGWSKPQHAGFLHLSFNDSSISELPVGDEAHESASSQSLVLHLQRGDILYLWTVGNVQGTIEMMGEDRTTFMGYLIQAD